MSTRIRELQYRVKLLVEEQESLWRQEQALKAQIDKMTARQRQLNNSFNRSGLIGKAKQALAQAELERDDEHRPLVVWIGPPQLRGRPYVVDKVTAKRIYVRPKGHSRSCDQFNRDGTSVSRHCKDKIDLKATFGDDYEVS